MPTKYDATHPKPDRRKKLVVTLKNKKYLKK